MYRLLCVIPDDHLKQHPSIAKVYDEMERKFGAYKETPPEVSEFVEVGPPLPEQAYQKMTLEQWLSSFKRYGESTGWDQPGEDFLKGGIVEHSRRFTEEVSKRPENFYEFVFSLGQRDDIPLMYLEAGINGLVKAQYDLEKVKTLVKTYWRFSDSGFRRAITWAIDYINKQDVLGLELIKILEEYVLHDPDPAEESWKIKTDGGTAYYGGDPLNSGINTVRGAAASQLAIHGYKTSYPDKVFDIMQQAATDPAVSVRCCLITDLQGMLRWDREKTYHIFITLTQDLHPQIIKYGLPCLAYLMAEENFQTFIPHLKIAMGLDEQVGYQHVQDYVGQILMLAYVKNYPESKELLEEGFRISDHTKTGAIKFASKHLLEQNKEVADKSKEIFLRFLDEDSEEIGRTYDTVFHAFEPKDFKPLYGLFEAYIKSKAASYAAHWFFEYMMQCIESEPEKCLDLLQQYLTFNQLDTQQRAFARRDKHVQILIGAYNKLTDTEYQEKAMDIFDAMLKDSAYKREGLKILEEQQDRG